MSIYIKNGRKFKWGPGVIKLNPDKSAFLRKHAIGKCLDIGCGSGIYTAFLHNLGHQIVGVDAETTFVEQAAKTYPQVTFSYANALHLPFSNNEFDTVVLFDILEHLDDKALLKEAFRVGKRVIISVPHTNQIILSEYSLMHAHYLDRTHIRTYTLTSLRRLLKSHKARVISCRGSLPISISGLFIRLISANNMIKKTILKIILKPFMPEPHIWSTIFAVAEKK